MESSAILKPLNSSISLPYLKQLNQEKKKTFTPGKSEEKIDMTSTQINGQYTEKLRCNDNHISQFENIQAVELRNIEKDAKESTQNKSISSVSQFEECKIEEE